MALSYSFELTTHRPLILTLASYPLTLTAHSPLTLTLTTITTPYPPYIGSLTLFGLAIHGQGLVIQLASVLELVVPIILDGPRHHTVL